MNEFEMDRLFQWLRRLNKVHKVSYDVMGQAIKYSGVGVSKGIKKETLSFEQAQEIAEKTGFSEEFNELFLTKANKKTPPEEARFEDIISEKVVEMLKPFIQKKTDQLLTAVSNLDLDFQEMKNTQEEIKATQAKTQESIENLKQG